MDWKMLAQRQAVGDWRDRHMLDAIRVLNSQCQQARELFELQIPEASFLDIFWDPAAFARPRIDDLLGKPVSESIAQLLHAAAEELKSIDPHFCQLADALSAASVTSFIPADPLPALPVMNAQPSLAPVVDGGGWRDYLPKSVRDSAKSVGDKIFEVVDSYSSELARIMRDNVMQQDRLRRAAGDRIAIRWMGLEGEPLPVLAQLHTMIDEIAHEARMTFT